MFGGLFFSNDYCYYSRPEKATLDGFSGPPGDSLNILILRKTIRLDSLFILYEARQEMEAWDQQ